MNDFPDCVTQGELHLNVHYATAFVTEENPDDVIIKLNCLFEEICTWCRLNKLTFHIGKSEIMIMQRVPFVDHCCP